MSVGGGWLLWAWLGSALAGSRGVASVAADVAIATPERRVGASGMAGIRVAPRWTLEVAGDLHLGTAWSGGLRLETRWRPAITRTGPSLLVGGGLERQTPVASAGLALDVTPRVRAQVRALLDLSAPAPPRILTLSLGWTFPAPPPPPSAPLLQPQHGDPTISAGTVPLTERLKEPDPAVVQVWLPHPVCAWVPASELGAWVGVLPPEARAELVAAGYLPQPIDLRGAAPVEMTPIPAQGAVVVAAGRGDVVTLSTAGAEGVPIPLDAAGTAVATVPEGSFQVTISGGGRTVVREGAVFDGYGTWVVVPDPEPLRVRFGAGQSTLSPAARAALAAVGRQSGQWRYQILGEASPEGAPEVNARLARARAEAVVAALVAAGVPADRIEILPSVLGAERVADVIPVAP